MLDILAPIEQEGTKAVVRAWLKKIGDTVALDDPLVELETDKVTQEVSAPCAGVLAEIVLESGKDALPGVVLGRIETQEAAQKTKSAQPAAAQPSLPVSSAAPTELDTRLSPAVRRAVSQHGLDPAEIEGTGRGGRITRADVYAVIEQRAAAPTETARQEAEPAQTPPLTKPSAPAQTSSGSRAIPHDSMRLAIARNMLNSVSTAPHVTAVFEVDFSAIIAHRNAYRKELEKQGVSLSYTAYIVQACVAAMQAVPQINSRWHEDHLEIFNDVNIGVGTALGDKGLIVPVIHQAQNLSLAGIAGKLQDLTSRARSGSLSGADVRGGTFTISNHGVSGSLLASPIIINQPQSAILGVGKLEKRVVVREVDGADTIQIRPLAYVSLTIDHRALDGHQTNSWLTAFKTTLETWPR